MDAAVTQHKALSRFSRRHMGADGAPHRNVSALVLNIRDEGPAFARATRGPMAQDQAAVPATPLPGAPAVPEVIPARPAETSAWKTACLCCLLLGCALGGALVWYAWTLRQDLALLETTLSALAEDSARETSLLRLNPSLRR